jgi:hypothetical protein
MTRTLLRLMLAAAAALVLGVGGAAAASTEVTTTAECPAPKWHVTWTSEEAETLQECGGEAIASQSDTTGSGAASRGDRELPLTSGPAILSAVFALGLVGLGAGLYLITRGQRRVFTV